MEHMREIHLIKTEHEDAQMISIKTENEFNNGIVSCTEEFEEVKHPIVSNLNKIQVKQESNDLLELENESVNYKNLVSLDKHYNESVEFHNVVENVLVEISELEQFESNVCESFTTSSHCIKGNCSMKKQYKCNICSFSCLRRSYIKRHLLTHSGKKPLKHIKTYLNKKLFKCCLCSYSCKQSSHLKTHTKTHTGEKPFICKFCNYSSSQSSNLKRHMKTHTGEKPFKCNLCSYTSSQYSNLVAHMKTHTGEKPFKCNLCGYSSIRFSQLKSHIRTHTGERPFKCNLCSYTCKQSLSLRRHIKRHTLGELI